MRSLDYLALFAVTVAPFFTSCSYGERARVIEQPAQAIEEAIDLVKGNEAIDFGMPLLTSWWELFDDPQLNQCILTALANNPSIDKSRVSIASARFYADKVRANLYPNLSWGADVSRQKLSETGLIPFNQNDERFPVAPAAEAITAGRNNIPVYFTQYETEAILSYEFDIWGKNRQALKAAIGAVQAARADDIFTRLELAIGVATVYFQLQINYQQLEIAQSLVENNTHYLELIEKRRAHNLSNNLAVNIQKINLSGVQQQLLQIEGEIAVNEYRLKALLAQSFEETIQIARISLPKIPLPKDISTNLIARRPDIIAKLWLIESAGKQIDVAKAGFYPNFNLGAVFGYQTLHLNKLFRWPSSFYNVDPAVNLPIFDGGLLTANLHSSEVTYDLAIYEYNRLVINAVEEVLKGLAILTNSHKQLLEYKRQAIQQSESYELTRLKVAHNINSELDSLLAEQLMLTAFNAEMIAFGHTVEASLALIKALGGGYETCLEASP
jgi:NodT family efflux transporter outer membrane factor (OMF) lipoprotein